MCSVDSVIAIPPRYPVRCGGGASIGSSRGTGSQDVLQALNDLELIELVGSAVKIFRDHELPRHVFARMFFGSLYTLH